MLTSSGGGRRLKDVGHIVEETDPVVFLRIGFWIEIILEIHGFQTELLVTVIHECSSLTQTISATIHYYIIALAKTSLLNR